MDPVTQGALGAVAAQLGGNPPKLLQAATFGALGGMAPDLDVLIRSATDPLLALEFHRQFTHSLFFIPLIGGLCGLVLHALLGRRWAVDRGEAMLWCTLGCATHGLLDGCTSYGTQLLWPLSNQRFAWDTISIIDLLFTLPLIAAIVLAVRRRSRRWAVAGAGWALFYLGIGFVQHERAVAAGYELAASRGHQPQRLEAKPSFGNLVVWKVIYAFEDRFYVDAVRVGLDARRVWPGDSIARLDVARDFPWLNQDHQQWQDIQRFTHFSAGFVAVDPDDPLRVVDIRYSMLPQRIDPLWGIELSPQKSAADHVTFFTRRENSGAALERLLDMVVGEG